MVTKEEIDAIEYKLKHLDRRTLAYMTVGGLYHNLIRYKNLTEELSIKKKEYNKTKGIAKLSSFS